MELWQVVLTSGTIVALVNGIQQIILWKMKRKAALVDKASDKEDALSCGIMAMLEDRLLYLGTEYTERGAISASQYSSYERMYKAYNLTNDNGAIRKLKKQIDELEIKTE